MTVFKIFLQFKSMGNLKQNLLEVKPNNRNNVFLVLTLETESTSLCFLLTQAYKNMPTIF